MADIKNLLFISSLAFVILTTSFVVAPTFSSPPSIQICNVLCPSKKSAIAGSTFGAIGSGAGVISGLSCGLVIGSASTLTGLSPFLPVNVGIPKSSKNPIGIPPKYFVPFSSYSKSDALPQTLMNLSTLSAWLSSTCW